MTTPWSEDAKSTWTCGLSRAGSYQAQAVWNAASTLSYTPLSEFKCYRDLSGNLHTITAGAVNIGAQPLLLENSCQ